jgi:peptidoglycan hydrolase-like protein with peptidoglycan-binding domain
VTWLSEQKYERIPIEGAAGSYIGNTAWKFINHSTEGPPGSINGTIALFKASPGSCPHFMIDPMGTGRRIQHIRLDYSACALRGGQGGYQTNRARAIQMEICGYAQDAADWPDNALWQIADVIADVIKAGYPINADNTPDSSRLRGTLATMGAPQRMSGPAFHAFDGIAAHVYVPFNDHWDCGQLRSEQVAAYVKEIVGGTSRTIVPRPAEGPLPNAPASTQAGYLVKGMTGGKIALVQQLLSGLRYNVGPGGSDGVFGFGTEQAVIAFQREHRLVADGIVGPATSAALSTAYAAINGKPAIPAPASAASGAPAWAGRFLVLRQPLMTGGDIRTWQRQMETRGWRIIVDGVYGELSEATCQTFQNEKGLTPDGIVGPQTWNATWAAPVT